MSAYGDVLSAFPELQEPVQLFSVNRQDTGAYTFTKLSVVTGVLQTAGTRYVVRNGVTVKEGVVVAWLTKRPASLPCAIQVGGEYYTAMTDEDWRKEGSFTRIEFHKIVGNTKSASNTRVAVGKFYD